MRLSRRRLLAGAAGVAPALKDALTADAAAAVAAPTPEGVDAAIDWPAFLAPLDPVWERMPAEWWEAPFLGNGMLGTMVRQIGERQVRFDVDRSDVEEHEGPDPANRNPSNGHRLPIGHFTLNTVGRITGGTIRLDLWNAEATGTLATDAGAVRWRGLVHADEMVIAVELERTGGEAGAALEWHADTADDPRMTERGFPEGYKHNPSPVRRKVGDVEACVQALVWGGETTTAWHEEKDEARDGMLRSVLRVSVAHTYPAAASTAPAVAAVKKARRADFAAWTRAHRDWWHRFYPASFLTLPDTRWESFYWIQLYKIASATRADRALVDNQGPWLQPTPWPASWWNLNVQLTYWPTYASNHLELAESLSRHLDEHVDSLIGNVAAPYRADSAGIARSAGQDLVTATVGVPGVDEQAEVGNLTWALHDYFLQYRMSMDDARLRRRLFPLLRRAVNYYLHFLTPDAQGTLHLPATYSPEYGSGPDCNYDLALLRWGLTALLWANDRLKLNDPLAPKWRDALARLTDYPQDANGYTIARGVPFDKGHRHFSHLLMAYPLYLVNAEQPGAKEKIVTSVRHWHSMGGRLGYSFTGGASLYASFGMGNEALELLNGLNRFLQASTMYRESGPVIETPLSAAKSIQDMLLQSWGDTIRVFPAAPDAWPDIAFHDLRAEGAFLVSALRQGGATRWVRVKSLAGEPCRIRPGLAGAVRATVPIRPAPKDGAWDLTLRKGQEALLYVGDRPPAPRLAVRPVPAPPGAENPWGLKKTAAASAVEP